MMKSLTGFLERRLSALVLGLMVIQPALDVFSYFLEQQVGSNTISVAAANATFTGLEIQARSRWR